MPEFDPRPHTPHGDDAAAAAQVLSRLDKTLRMHRLYEAEHELVRGFDHDLRTAMRAYLLEYGDLRVRVRPNAFEVAGKLLAVQGLDELALTLFRQGIVALRLLTSITDAELSSFVSLCNKGIQSRSLKDDDLATLLWRGNFPGIKYVAILGYTEEEGGGLDEMIVDAESVADALGDTLAADLDKLPAETRKELEQRLAKLRGADEDLAQPIVSARARVLQETRLELGRHAFGIVRSVVSMPRRSADVSAQELRGWLSTFRSVFIEHADLDGLIELAALVRSLLESVTTPPDDKAALQALVKQPIDEHQFTAMLARIGGGVATNVQKLATVIEVLASNDRALIARLADLSDSEKGRGALDQMLVDVTGDDTEYLIRRFRSLEGARAVEVLSLLVRQDPVQARMALAVRLPGAGDETQIELLAAVHTIPYLYDARLRAALLRLAAKGGPLRNHIFASFSSNRDPEVIDTVWQWITSAEFDQWDARTVESAFAMLLSCGEQKRVLPLCEQILERKALLRRKQLAELKCAVIAALTVSQAPETRELLTLHAESHDKEIAEACHDALERITTDRARIRGSLRPSEDSK